MNGLMQLVSLTVPSRVEFVRVATAFLVQSAKGFEVGAASEAVFEVAISEAIANAVKHGSAAPGSTITCELQLDQDGSLTIRIIDDGRGFELRNFPMPEVSRDRIDSIPASGYGLPIIHTVFPNVRFVNINGRFAVELQLPVVRHV